MTPMVQPSAAPAPELDTEGQTVPIPGALPPPAAKTNGKLSIPIPPLSQRESAPEEAPAPHRSSRIPVPSTKVKQILGGEGSSAGSTQFRGVLSPLIGLDVGEGGSTKDWAVIEIDDSKVDLTNFVGNVIDSAPPSLSTSSQPGCPPTPPTRLRSSIREVASSSSTAPSRTRRCGSLA